MKHNQTLTAPALVAGALVGAVQTVAGNPSAARAAAPTPKRGRTDRTSGDPGSDRFCAILISKSPSFSENADTRSD